MDMQSPNGNPCNQQKLEPELARYQRVLDAYQAHPGEAPEPSGALDARILARAASALPAKTQVPKRRWPMALAASVATIGFAALLTRHSLREPAPNYESAPAMQESKAAAPAPPSASRQEDAVDGGAAKTLDAPEKSDAVTAEKRESAGLAKPAEPIGALSAGAPEDRASDRSAQPAAQAAEPAPSLSEVVEEGAEQIPEPKPMAASRAKRALAQPAPASASIPSMAPTPSVAAPAPAPPPQPPPPASPVQATTQFSTEGGDARAGMRANNAARESADAAPQADAEATEESGRPAAQNAPGLAADPDAVVLTRIRELRAEGQLKQARELLRKFQKEHPELSIPEDLRDLLED